MGEGLAPSTVILSAAKDLCVPARLSAPGEQVATCYQRFLAEPVLSAAEGLGMTGILIQRAIS